MLPQETLEVKQPVVIFLWTIVPIAIGTVKLSQQEKTLHLGVLSPLG